MQLALTLSLPPTNHWACGSFQTRTLSHVFAQSSDFACSAQRPSGSALAFYTSASYSATLLKCADAENAGGGKVRDSLRTLVMLEEEGEDMAIHPL